MKRRLPRFVFSMFGTMRLTREDGACPEKAFGVFKPNERYVGVHSKTAGELEWPTYWHEATHVALFETGVANTLTHEQTEAVCDAIGLYLDGMMKAGMLRVVTPRNLLQKSE